MTTSDIRSIGFLGFGNMAQAMADGWRRAPSTEKLPMYACAAHFDTLKERTSHRNITALRSARELMETADLVVIAIKPYLVEKVLRQALCDTHNKYPSSKNTGTNQQDVPKAPVRFLSVAAGWNFSRYQEVFPNISVACCIPSTPVSVNQGVIALEDVSNLPEEDYKQIEYLLSQLGTPVSLPSHLLSIGGTVGGCTPAFFAMIIEALSDAAVKHGIPRDKAYTMVSCAMAGTALTQLQTGKHPGILKDEVCSPGGTTIRGVSALEKAGLRTALIQAIDAIEGENER